MQPFGSQREAPKRPFTSSFSGFSSRIPRDLLFGALFFFFFSRYRVRNIAARDSRRENQECVERNATDCVCICVYACGTERKKLPPQFERRSRRWYIGGYFISLIPRHRKDKEHREKKVVEKLVVREKASVFSDASWRRVVVTNFRRVRWWRCSLCF